MNQHPYILDVDHQVEIFALLSLAAIAHVASIFKAGVTWDIQYLFLACVLFLLPILTFVGGTAFMAKLAKKELKILTDRLETVGQEAKKQINHFLHGDQSEESGNKRTKVSMVPESLGVMAQGTVYVANISGQLEKPGQLAKLVRPSLSCLSYAACCP